MSQQIRITPDQLQTKSTEFRQQAEALERMIQDMDRLFRELEGMFEGNAARAYQQQYQDCRPSFVRGQEVTETISLQAAQMAENFGNMDQQMAQALGG